MEEWVLTIGKLKISLPKRKPRKQKRKEQK